MWKTYISPIFKRLIIILGGLTLLAEWFTPFEVLKSASKDYPAFSFFILVLYIFVWYVLIDSDVVIKEQKKMAQKALDNEQPSLPFEEKED